MKPFVAAFLLVAVAVFGPDTADHNVNWPQWRGPGGLAVGTGAYPEAWSPTEHIAWKTTLPNGGQGGIAVWGDRLFLTAFEEYKEGAPKFGIKITLPEEESKP